MKAEHHQNGLPIWRDISFHVVRQAALTSPWVVARPSRHSHPGGSKWWCQTTMAAVSTTSLPPGLGALLSCQLNKLPSVGGISVPRVSSPALDMYYHGGNGPNGTWTAGLVSFIRAACWKCSRTQRYPGNSPCHHLLKVWAGSKGT